jgi:hypothetical protein
MNTENIEAIDHIVVRAGFFVDATYGWNSDLLADFHNENLGGP